MSPILGVRVAHPDDLTRPTFGSVALHRGDPGFPGSRDGRARTSSTGTAAAWLPDLSAGLD